VSEGKSKHRKENGKLTTRQPPGGEEHRLGDEEKPQTSRPDGGKRRAGRGFWREGQNVTGKIKRVEIKRASQGKQRSVGGNVYIKRTSKHGSQKHWEALTTGQRSKVKGKIWGAQNKTEGGYQGNRVKGQRLRRHDPQIQTQRLRMLGQVGKRRRKKKHGNVAQEGLTWQLDDEKKTPHIRKTKCDWGGRA